MTKEKSFYRGRHFCIPKSCFILFALPSHEWKKLDRWIKKKQRPEIAIAPNGEVFLINAENLEQHRKRQEKSN